jgi:predicted PurR-regulated permease PerM
MMIKWVLTFLLIWFIYSVRSIFPPIIVGAIIAYLFLPVVQKLARTARIPIGLATACVYITLGVVIGSAIYFLGPGIVRELSELVENRHSIVSNSVSQFATMTHWTIDVGSTTSHMLGSMSETFSKPSEIAHWGHVLGHGALSVLVCVVTAIYLTLDSDKVGQFLLRYVPGKRRQPVIDLAAQMNRILSRYMQGQVYLIVIMSTIAWLFLHFVIHMKYALPVALLSGFFEIIPVLGPIVATSTAAIVGMSQFGPKAAVIIVIFYTLARWFEDYVIVPKVIGHAVEMHALAVIFAVLCGEVMAGALGMLIAIPVAACIKLVIDFFYLGKVPDPHEPTEDKPVSGPAAAAANPEAKEGIDAVQNAVDAVQHH